MHEGLDSLDFDETPRDEVALRDFLLEEERFGFPERGHKKHPAALRVD